MNLGWRQYADRIDALTLRERALLFLGVVAGVILIMTLVYIDPVVSRKQQLSRRLVQQQNELKVLQGQIQELGQQRAAPEAANRARIDSLKHQIAELNATLNTLSKSLVAAQDMKTLLQDMLARNSRVQLIAMRTLPAAPLVEKREPGQKTENATAKPNPSEGNVFKHGVQITLEGSYGELYDYLVSLEKQPWHMFWSRASLNAEDYPRLFLTVTVYTLSLDQAWLVV